MTARQAPSIVEFVTDPQLLGLTLSPAQETLLRAIYGLPLSEEQLMLWRQCTGREDYPAQPFAEVTVIAGARAGKDSRIAAPIVLYEALFGGHDQELQKGERGILPLIAQDARATRVAFSYIRDYATGSPLIRQLIEEEREAELWLTNGMRVVSFACTAKSIRGWSIPSGVMDEVAFFRLEAGAAADVEVQTAIRRGMVGFTHPRLVKISTPYIKSGVLYEDFTRYFGQADPDVLVWRASSLLMNPTLAGAQLDRQQRVDAQRFAREYEAEFADDVEGFLPAAWIDAAVVAGRHELPPRRDVAYVAAVDPSGGGADAFTLAIVHVEAEGERVIQDVMKGWAGSRASTVDLASVVREVAAILRRYGLTEVLGDRYAGAWVAQAFDSVGVLYRDAEMAKAEAYLAVEPLVAQGRVELLDHQELARELLQLERRPRVGGKTLVDHPRGGHDDYANAVALAIAATAGGLAGGGLSQLYLIGARASEPDPDPLEVLRATEAQAAQERELEARQARALWTREEAWRQW